MSASVARGALSTGSPLGKRPGCTPSSASIRSAPTSAGSRAPSVSATTAAALTNRDLAAAVHVSPSTSSERVRGLRGTGVIRGYHADVALEALGRRVQALIAVTIRPPSREHIEAFRDWAG